MPSTVNVASLTLAWLVTQIAAGAPESNEDALVPGTEFQATAEIPCGFDGAEPTSRCPAGVIRGWGEDGTMLVEITKRIDRCAVLRR